MKRVLLILSAIGLIECSDKDDALCSKKYESKQFGVTIHHSDNWNDPYEFYGHNIGMEYKGLEDFERRYDAEIIITFSDHTISQKEFFDIYKQNDFKQNVVESMGGSFESKTFDKGTTEFASKKWKTVGVEEKGSLEGEVYNSRETNYLWFSSSRQVAIRVIVNGQGDIEGLDDEVDCILSKLVFQN